MSPEKLKALAERVMALPSCWHGNLELQIEVAAAFGRYQAVVAWGRGEAWKEWDDGAGRWIAPMCPLRSLDDLVRVAKPWIGDTIPSCPVKATAAALLARAQAGQ